ncbi:MAG: hypothetical protein K2H40_14270 [Lachnospiraceae bacterium]|nr:hypothetical protein [Lachnospiraceae bacterium]
MDIRLNTRNLQDDIKEIRRIRSGINGDMEIRLIWSGNNVQHEVCVVANGPNLWVKGYYDRNRDFIAFDTTGGARILNYADDDKGCALTLDAIASVLEELEKIPPVNDFSQGGENQARKAYIMCVFLVSEMVRNELLERMLLQGTRNHGQNCRTWRDYILVYKNWAKVSRELYQTGGGDNYPTIYAADVRSMYSRLQASVAKGIMTERELAVYDSLLAELRIV